jgi:hypothetical protein
MRFKSSLIKNLKILSLENINCIMKFIEQTIIMHTNLYLLHVVEFAWRSECRIQQDALL